MADENNLQDERSLIILAKEADDFTKIAIAASQKHLTIEEIGADEESIEASVKILRRNELGVRAIKITFADSNGTRQAFIDSLNSQAVVE